MISLSKSVLDANPEFSKFLSFLSSRFNNDGVSIEQDKKAKKLEIQLLEKRKEYFKRKIFHDKLFGLITRDSDYTINQDDFRNAFVDSQIYDALSHEGFKKEEFLIPSIADAHNSNKWDEMKKDIEENVGMELTDTLTTIHHSYTHLMHHDKGEFPVDRLPELITMDMSVLEDLKETLTQTRISAHEAQLKYLEALSSSSRTILDILQKYLLHNLPHTVANDVSYMDQQLEALSLKLNNTRFGLISDTYSRDAIKVLHFINKELTQEIEGTKSEERSLSDLLDSYESMGSEFSEMVKKYSRLKDEIENKKWALNEVKKSQI